MVFHYKGRIKRGKYIVKIANYKGIKIFSQGG